MLSPLQGLVREPDSDAGSWDAGQSKTLTYTDWQVCWNCAFREPSTEVGYVLNWSCTFFASYHYISTDESMAANRTWALNKKHMLYMKFGVMLEDILLSSCLYSSGSLGQCLLQWCITIQLKNLRFSEMISECLLLSVSHKGTLSLQESKAKWNINKRKLNSFSVVGIVPCRLSMWLSWERTC